MAFLCKSDLQLLFFKLTILFLYLVILQQDSTFYCFLSSFLLKKMQQE